MSNFLLNVDAETKFGLISGAGAVGGPIGEELLKWPFTDWRVIFTRRSDEAVAALRRQIEENAPKAAWRANVIKLDPADPRDIEGLIRWLRRDRIRLDMLVLASGKAILDSAAKHDSYKENLRSNYESKQELCASLLASRSVESRGDLVVISSKVLDFAQNAAEVADQQGYRASIAALEHWTRELRSTDVGKELHRINVPRVPLVMGSTADEYLEKGIVPQSVVPTDPYSYARVILDEVIG